MMLKKVSSARIATMGESIFTTMSKLAFEKNAVNLGQGFPDFDGYSMIFESAYRAMKEGKNQYAPSPGIKSLRDVISVVNSNHYGIDYNPDTEITITAGATEALYCVMQAFLNPGDEAILFEPYYDAHYADVILAGGIPKFVTLHKPDFSFSHEELENAITPKTKLIVLNTPHNPTGKVFSQVELEMIAKIAIAHDLLVVSDEVYEFLTFDSVKHFPIAKLDGMIERTITISSTGKTFGSTGWKVGYVCAAKELTDAIRKVHQWTTFAVNTPAQHAMADAFGTLDSYLPDFRALYQNKRDLLFNALKGTEYNPYLPEGSYFMMIDVPKKFDGDLDAAMKLVNEFSVAVIPPSVFYSKSNEGTTLLRLCFAKKDETLIKGAENLLNAIKS
jgi:aspartate/methionine/tyrosine aminotransferase